VAAGVVAALLWAAAPASADTFTVTVGTDDTVTPPSGSLRKAIVDAEANDNDPVVDQINFTYTGNIGLTGFLDQITEPLTLNGPGASSLNVTRSGSASGTFGYFLVQPLDPAYTVTIRGITMSGADATPYTGGALQMLAPGTLVLDSVVISGNTGGQTGGLYYNQGLTSIRNSTLSDNHVALANDGGGAIEGAGTGEAQVVSSTIDNNTSPRFGGGVFLGEQADIRFLSSTITHNEADSDANGSGDGGGIYNSSAGTVAIANTLLAGNTIGDGGGDTQCGGSPVASSGYNLRSQSDTGCSGFGAPGDIVRTSPLIASIPATNGGPTPNIALLPGSPAINAGNPATLGGAFPACPTKDQRGLFRGGVAGRCDIGSYEFNASASPPATGGGSTPPPPATTTTTTTTTPTFDLAAAKKRCKKKFPKGPKRKKCIKRAKRRAQAG
jgi:hypothetical protein